MLVQRLGQYECPTCASAVSSEQPHSLAAEFQYFSKFSNAHVKRWLFSIYGFYALLPTLLQIVLLWLMFFLANEFSIEPTTCMRVLPVLLMIGFVAIALQLMVLYLILFSDIYWLKWFGYLQCLWNTVSCAIAIFIPDYIAKRADPEMVQSLGLNTYLWIVMIVVVLSLFYTGWMSLILWKDIRGLQLNRKLQRRYA